LLLRVRRKFDGLQGIAYVMVHQTYHLKPVGKVPASAALNQEGDEADNHTS